MSRLVHGMFGLVLLIGIAGCGNSDKPATSTPTPDPVEQQKQEEQMKKYHPEAGDQ